jgi:uncharacterized protein
VEFEWDPVKADANVAKHNITFLVGAQAWDDPQKHTLEDKRRDYGETRWITTGMTASGLVTIVYTGRDERNRSISARRANARERKTYEHGSRHA